MGLLIQQLTIKPENLHSRIEALFHREPEHAICHIKDLVQETVTRVNQYMLQIDIDTTTLQRQLEKQQKAWEFTVTRETVQLSDQHLE